MGVSAASAQLLPPPPILHICPHVKWTSACTHSAHVERTQSAPFGAYVQQRAAPTKGQECPRRGLYRQGGFSVVQLGEARHAALLPVVLRVALRDGEQQAHHAVRGVARRREHALALRRLVERRRIDARHVGGILVPLDRVPVHVGDLGEEHLGHALLNVAGAVIPARAFHEEAVHVAAGLRLRERLLLCKGLLQHMELPGQGVDGQLVLPGVVLQLSSQEGLREVEARDPVRRRVAALLPVGEEGYPSHEVRHVAGQRLERRVGDLHPICRPCVPQNARRHLVQVGVHHEEALHRLADVREGRAHAQDELVEAQHLLVQHRVQGLVVVNRVLGGGRLRVEGGRDVCKVLGAHLPHDLVGRLPPLAAAARALHGVGRLENVHALVDGTGEVSIGVQPEDLRLLVYWKAPDVLHVPLLVCELRCVVDARRREFVVVVVDLRAVEILDDGGDGDPVVGIGDAAAVVRL
mmetsp:Transcript_106049/g.295105  ORF Transcript_106049/g.295105 Transcript_106049/m.295105 type:complete len:466 (-) Transcript_106049:145-1542(-)